MHLCVVIVYISDPLQLRKMEQKFFSTVVFEISYTSALLRHLSRKLKPKYTSPDWIELSSPDPQTASQNSESILQYQCETLADVFYVKLLYTCDLCCFTPPLRQHRLPHAFLLSFEVI